MQDGENYSSHTKLRTSSDLLCHEPGGSASRANPCHIGYLTYRLHLQTIESHPVRHGLCRQNARNAHLTCLSLRNRLYIKKVPLYFDRKKFKVPYPDAAKTIVEKPQPCLDRMMTHARSLTNAPSEKTVSKNTHFG